MDGHFLRPTLNFCILYVYRCMIYLLSVLSYTVQWCLIYISFLFSENSCSVGLFMSTVFYISSVCGIAVMYMLYASKPSCTLNIFFISWTALLLVVMMVISLHYKVRFFPFQPMQEFQFCHWSCDKQFCHHLVQVNRGLLSSGIMASYLVFLCWSAIRRLDLYR